MNSLELKKHPSGNYESTIVCNGVTTWELHPSYRTEIKVLETLRDKKYYQHYKGKWMVTLPDNYKTFTDDKLDTAIALAIAYIHERDLPSWEDHF